MPSRRKRKAEVELALACPATGRGAGRGMRPLPLYSVSEWAEANRRLSGKETVEPGPWRTDRTPYLREIMDSLSAQDPCDIVAFMKGAQIGATEAGNNWLGYVIDAAPAPMLYVEPTDSVAKRVSKTRVAPLIASTPALAGKVREPRSRGSSNTILLKEFDGGSLVLSGANSSAGLSNMPARNVFADEVDRWPLDVDDEGDPLELALGRTRAFRRNRKVFLASTPKIKGVSRIEHWHDRGDRRRYLVPCPACGSFQPIEWGALQWDKDGDEHKPETVRLVCVDCGERIPESRKPELLAAGHWQPTATPSDPRVRSYHLSALYSPLGWYSWADAVIEFLQAKRKGDEALKEWTNLTLGETWDEKAQGVDEGPLLARRERYPAEVPAPAVLLTAGVDIQRDRIELEVVGWTVDEASFAVAYSILYGDTDQGEVWEQLDVELSRTFKHESGALLPIAAACIDAGFKLSFVTEFVRTRPGRRLFATIGRDGPNRALVSSPSAKRTGRNRRPIPLYTLGVDQLKALVYSRLRLTDPSAPGFCHFPLHEDFDAEYFAQLTAERVSPRIRKGRPFLVWTLHRARNEALDCRVYATAAITLLGQPALRVAARRLAARQGIKPEQLERSARRRRRPSWALGWKK